MATTVTFAALLLAVLACGGRGEELPRESPVGFGEAVGRDLYPPSFIGL